MEWKLTDKKPPKNNTKVIFYDPFFKDDEDGGIGTGYYKSYCKKDYLGQYWIGLDELPKPPTKEWIMEWVAEFG